MLFLVHDPTFVHGTITSKEAELVTAPSVMVKINPEPACDGVAALRLAMPFTKETDPVIPAVPE